MAKYAYTTSNAPPKGWRWEVFDEAGTLVRSGSAKGEQEATARAQAAIAKLERGSDEEE
jgi:hypothetical protein